MAIVPPPLPNEESFEAICQAFATAIDDCRRLYQTSGEHCAREHPGLIQGPADEFVQLMLDLHRGLLIKIYMAIVEADRRWSEGERELGRILLLRVWGRRADDHELPVIMKELVEKADALKWFNLIRPFDELAPLRNRVSELETIIMRVANLIAKVDGRLGEPESLALKELQNELERHLKPVPLDATGQHELAQKVGTQAVLQMRSEAVNVPRVPPVIGPPAKEASREELLAESLKQLDALIGLDAVKSEARGLINFLKIQEERARAKLPRTDLSLHMVFSGNPGTGKTSVARIIGRVFAAMGILEKGHVVETDRSGMVAGYVGQTAIKANKKIDEALGGVLFIDEAYSLVAEHGEDAYGPEAVQILLKRMEDDRHRLVIVLAGYPEPLNRLLESNPGLASRFHRRFEFPDYSVIELCRIFQSLCEANHYQLPPATRLKLLAGFSYLVAERDERFGNGRLVRNVFEGSIRRLANRVIDIAPLTETLLTTLEPQDIAMPDVPQEVWNGLDDARLKVQIDCPGCHQLSSFPAAHLGRRVRCNRCGHRFRADWREINSEFGIRNSE